MRLFLTTMILPVFHLTVVLINGFAIFYDQHYVDLPFAKAIAEQKLVFKNRLIFLTMWCQILQTVYFAVALLNDIVGTNKRSPMKFNPIRCIKDHLFSLALPIAIYVFLAFWIIFIIDQELILPDHIRKVMPSWLNHVLHTTIVPFIFLELILSPRNYPSRTVGISIIVTFTAAYLTYLYSAFLKTGTWVYPVLDVLPWHIRIVFFGLSTLFSIFMYIVGEKICLSLSPRATGKLKGR